MRTLYALGVCLFVMVPAISLAQEKQPPPREQQKQSAPVPAEAEVVHPVVITPEEKARKNPTKFTEESVEKGKKLYATQCAMCHGKTGDGKGDLAEVMHVAPPDFTKPETLSKRTDGELFAIIGKGSAGMPAEAERLKENQVWDLVNFMRSLQGEKPAKSNGNGPGGVQP